MSKKDEVPVILASGGVVRWRYALALAGRLGKREREKAEKDGPSEGAPSFGWVPLYPFEGVNGEHRWN